MDETLREAACLGNLDSVQKLLRSGADVNSKNSMNGWTALHWACKRGHTIVVRNLLQHGADVNLKTLKGETPAAVTTSSEILSLLGSPQTVDHHLTNEDLPIVPHYLQHPPFPYGDIPIPDTTTISEKHTHKLEENSKCVSSQVAWDCHARQSMEDKTTDSLLVKVRVFGSGESDFIEVEVPALSYSALLNSCCEELDISSSEVTKIRKLPNVLIRKDKDVQRLKEGQELEIVMQSKDTIT